MDKLFAPCWACTHRIEPASIAAAGQAKCTAYPDGIPADILQGEPHDTARGDERDGITFEQGEDPDSIFYGEAWREFRAALESTR